MSIRFISNDSSNNTDVVAKTYSSLPPTRLPTPWVRNPSWPACEANPGDNRVRGLYAVWPSGANFIALNVAGNYTVNFGDGTITNFDSGLQANYEYSYDDPDLVGTEAPVTFTDVNDTVNRTAHGYTDGMRVQFYNITNTTGIVNAQIYFVINATANTFQVSATAGGSVLPLTNDGTGQLLPYRIATVTITPQAGADLTSINLYVKHNQLNLQAYATGWLDLAFAASTITSLTIGSQALTLNHSYLECARLNQLGAITTFLNLFAFCRRLQNVEIANTITSVTNMEAMFINCNSLQTIPLFNTASVTNMLSMFQGCNSLITIPELNTASVTNMSSMFRFCASLTTIPMINTSSVTNMTSMFQSCGELATLPLLNTASVTNMTSMFQNASSLKTVPLFNTVSVTSMLDMFRASTALETVPLFNTASVNDMSNMFFGCSRLESVPQFNTTSVTNMTRMFANCVLLQTAPLLNTASVTNMLAMFDTCFSLQTIPLLNTASVTNMQQMFQNCSSIETVPLLNTASVTNMQNMFANCLSLKSVPLFNTASVTNMQNMFQICSALTTVPLFNTASVTNMAAMFINCNSLATIPQFNTASVINMQQMFSGCNALSSVPALNTTAVNSQTNLFNMFNACNSLARIQAGNFRFTFSVASCKLSANAITEIYNNLPTIVGTTQTISISSNYGVDAAITKSVTTTAQSATVPMSDTTGLSVGQFVTGTNTGITTGISVNSTVTTDIFTLSNHGLTNGTRISFSALGSTTGISLWTIYFVVNATANTFQISLTPGGAAIDLTGTNSTLTARYPSFITGITTNSSVTLSSPAATSGSTTLSFRLLNSSTPLLRNWTVTF